MEAQQFSALIVDDDFISQQAVGIALGQQDFSCAYAWDGDDALRRIAAEKFDLIVTDLRMPNKNGHALVVDLLALDTPPVIVVHSSVDNPRLTKDLMERGIDDIIYKPTNYEAFANKVTVLVQRRKKQAMVTATANTAELLLQSKKMRDEREQVAVVVKKVPASVSKMSLEEYNRRLANVQRLFPLSSVAYEVFMHANSPDTCPVKLAAALATDAALAADILRIANNVCHNPRNRPTLALDEAVSRIGFRKVGEIALALSALGALRGSVLPWLDSELEQTRSTAASIASGHLSQVRNCKPFEGMSLCALLHPLGRLVRGSVFKDEYQLLIQRCADENESLIELEQQLFPECHTAVLGRLLSEWNVPGTIWLPLCYAGESYEAVAALEPKIRDQVELLKLAKFIGDVAARRWMSWDQVEPPPAELLARHGMADLQQAIEYTSEGIKRPDDSQKRSKHCLDVKQGSRTELDREKIVYQSANGPRKDWMPHVLQSVGVDMVHYDSRKHSTTKNLVINCIGSPASRIEAIKTDEKLHNVPSLLLATKTDALQSDETREVLSFPTSVASLQLNCRKFSAI